METQHFWQQLVMLGGLHSDWWYSGLAIPALLLALGSLAITLIAIRANEGLTRIFIPVQIACLPLLLIMPSAYAAARPDLLLGMLGQPWPQSAGLPRESALALAQQLNLLSQLGLIGALSALLIACGGMIAIGATSDLPPISGPARQITQIVRDKTQRFRRDQALPSALLNGASCPYGWLEVLNGNHAGNQFAIRPGNTLGRRECDIVLSDAVASRLHARFELDEQQTLLADQQSANGLYVYRLDSAGAQHKLELALLPKQRLALQSGDVIALGDPDHAEDGQFAVRLRFHEAWSTKHEA